MPRRPQKVPDAHGPAAPPATALRRLAGGARVLRPLGGNANMHWLVSHPGGRHARSAQSGDAASGGPAVLRRYGPWHTPEDVAYELRVLDRIAALGWPVPQALAPPQRVGRHLWALFRYLPGRPRRPRAPAPVQAELRARGRLLAALHADLETLTDLPQRPGWRRREEVLNPWPDGPSVEEIIRARVAPDDAAVMLEYAGRARERFAALGAARLPAMVTHGDLIGSNVLYSRGALSGVIDFDFAHLDLRVADFVWTWRGKYDDFVRGYEEVTPLTGTERALLAPAYWVTVLDSARMELLWGASAERVPLPGAVAYLRRRSKLTGDGIL
jgi:Ser/Thr protein kinase RdoA (MazF antagonist)